MMKGKHKMNGHMMSDKEMNSMMAGGKGYSGKSKKTKKSSKTKSKRR